MTIKTLCLVPFFFVRANVMLNQIHICISKNNTYLLNLYSTYNLYPCFWKRYKQFRIKEWMLLLVSAAREQCIIINS